MIGTRSGSRLGPPRAPTARPFEDAVAVVDGALMSVRGRDAMNTGEALALLEAVRATATDLGAEPALAAIADELARSCDDVARVGTLTVADALLDIRLTLAGPS
jgi:hypothetical protein